LDRITQPEVILPEVSDWNAHVFHLFVIRTPKRDEMLRFLNDHGVQALVHYPVPPHRQKAYRELNHLHLPVTEKIHKEVLSLPISQVVTDEEVEMVVRVVNSFCSQN
ncbi:DegT/DnrJ/EryC1/StrS family aminotransferase, partial [Proteiniphilum sp. UBA5259]|uniref:DegT/DnrJ/EryC1/StrS family aminotransferase n=1 Tax=Proteiniphilum sp. UBA5259 TaxID=1947269 RepID=UPI00257B044F